MGYIQREIANIGLWPKLALIISLSFIILFVAFSALEEQALYDDSKRLLDARLTIARMTASQVDAYLQEAVFELEQLYRFAHFDSTDPKLSIETQNTLEQAGIFSSGIILLDSLGQVIISYPAGLYPPGRNLATLPHISQALNRQEVSISEAFKEPLNGQPVVSVTIPISTGGRFIGLLSGLVDLSGPTIETLLHQSIILGHTEHAALIDSDGRALASTFDLPFLSPGEHFSFYRRAIPKKVPLVETVPFELELPDEEADHLHIMALAPLQTVPWAVAVGGDQDETFAGVTRLRLRLTIIGVMALVIVWAVTLIGANKVMQPIRYLTQAARRINQGDLQTPLQVSSKGEIGILAITLDGMRQHLLANINDLTQSNGKLEAHVMEQTKMLRQQQAITQQLLRRMITAQEQERGHLSRELHDGLGQILTAIRINLERIAKILPPENENTRQALAETQDLIGYSLGDLRRIIAALRPGVIDQLGLAPALDWLSRHTLRPLEITVTANVRDMSQRLPCELEIIFFRIAQEAMNNIARHSRARQVTIDLRQQKGLAILTLTDDGCGFDPSSVVEVSDHSQGLGLAGIRERALLAGGKVFIKSVPGKGTTIKAMIPIPYESAAFYEDDPPNPASGFQEWL